MQFQNQTSVLIGTAVQQKRGNKERRDASDMTSFSYVVTPLRP